MRGILVTRTPPGKQPRDRIKILEDTTGAGKADKVTLFAEGKDLRELALRGRKSGLKRLLEPGIHKPAFKLITQAEIQGEPSGHLPFVL